jgi:hypothetical protein
MGWWSSIKKNLKLNVQMAKKIRDMDQGYSDHRDVVIKGCCDQGIVIKGHNIQKSKTPRDIPDRGHNSQGM